MPMMMGSSGIVRANATAASTTTWNSADKSASVALSGGDLIATSSSSGSVRAVASASSGKKYWELTVGARSGDEIFGILNSSTAIGTGYAAGFGADSAGYYINGSIYRESSVIATAESYDNGDVLGFALDLDNARFWVRKNAGSWNNDGSANPATNTNGIDVSQCATPLHPAATLNDTAVVTANFGGSAYSQTPPAGFGNW